MTKEEILAMQPGRELNAQIARLLGRPVYKNREGRWLIRTGSKSLDSPPLPYSTDISAAWQVVERMIAEGFMFYLRGDIKLEGWECNIYKAVPANYPVRWFEAAPEAICKAALLTKLEGD